MVCYGYDITCKHLLLYYWIRLLFIVTHYIISGAYKRHSMNCNTTLYNTIQKMTTRFGIRFNTKPASLQMDSNRALEK